LRRSEAGKVLTRRWSFVLERITEESHQNPDVRAA